MLVTVLLKMEEKKDMRQPQEEQTLQTEVQQPQDSGFETGEQLEKKAFARLAQLKASYLQQLGFKASDLPN